MTAEIGLTGGASGSPVPGRLPALILSLALALTGAAACDGPAEEDGRPGSPAEAGPEIGPAAATVGDLEIHAPRVQVTPGGATAAAYLTLVDTGGAGDRLLAVRTAAAESASLHESVDDDGVHRMVARPEGFAVPAGGALELAPGGKHVMLMGLRDGATGEDRMISLTLELERAGAVEIRVPAGDGAGPEDMDADHADH
ncbi:MAG: copper chaperone PCu(A)C [Acidobacteriota bacterium]|jgi:copper(I)-binding protein